MDEINKIRKAFFVNGETKNAIAKYFNRSWDTIHRIISMDRDDLTKRGRRPNRKAKVITSEVIQAICAYLDEEIEKKVRRKQRYTAKQIYKKLLEKGIYKGSKRQMQEAVRKLREERNQSKKQTFLPLFFPLGSALQVDHGEVDLEIKEQRFSSYLFVASVPGESLRYCQVFPTKSRESWGEFHERAFYFFGGIFPRIMYDNDSVVVKKVIGSKRYQTTFSLSLEEHFEFESQFCNLSAGNEKGAVENAVGYCRRNFFSGLPSFRDWDESNQYLEECCKKDILESQHYKTQKPLQLTYEELQEKLSPLPPRKSWGQSVDCRVNFCQLIRVDNHEYSVPEKYVGAQVRCILEVFKIKVFKEEELIATHERQYGNSDSLDLNHYLEQLQYKARAFWDCKAVHDHKFDQRYLRIWGSLSERYSSKEANRQFVKILLLGKKYSQKEILLAIETSLKYGAIDAAAVENILRQQEKPTPIFNKEELKKTLKSDYIFSWDFDLHPYAQLCNEVRL